MQDILESDWKKFKGIKEVALARYCDQSLNRYSEIIGRKDGSSHERYLDHFKEVQVRDQVMAQLFDGMSRSRAVTQLRAYRSHRLVDGDRIRELSEEFQALTKPF